MSIADQINFSHGTPYDVAIYAFVAFVVVVTIVAVKKS